MLSSMKRGIFITDRKTAGRHAEIKAEFHREKWRLQCMPVCVHGSCVNGR